MLVRLLVWMSVGVFVCWLISMVKGMFRVILSV